MKKPSGWRIYGSHGELRLDEKGKVIGTTHTDGPEYDGIVACNIEEYLRTYPAAANTDYVETDILDIGYWTDTDFYEPPDSYHRRMVQTHNTFLAYTMTNYNFHCPFCNSIDLTWHPEVIWSANAQKFLILTDKMGAPTCDNCGAYHIADPIKKERPVVR